METINTLKVWDGRLFIGRKKTRIQINKLLIEINFV